MNLRAVGLALILALVGPTTAPAVVPSGLREQAEALLLRGSFAQAVGVLEQVRTNDLAAPDLRWLEFRLADARWRAAAPELLEDSDRFAAPLVRLSSDDIPAAERDEFWAAARRSLGDLQRRQEPWGHGFGAQYAAALDWWAGQTNLSRARDQYLEIAHEWAGPVGDDAGWNQSILIPDDVLSRAISIAERPDDVAFFRLHRAIRSGNVWSSGNPGRAARDFEAARLASVGTPLRDAALYFEGQWRERQGGIETLPSGGWKPKPDEAGAIQRYRELLEEFPAGRSRYRESAASRLADLTGISMVLAVPGTFLPGSRIEFQLSARNTTNVQLSLTPMDLTRDLRLEAVTGERSVWQDGLRPPGPAIREWNEVLEADRLHAEVTRQVRLPETLAPGAYLLEARAGDQSVRDVLMVTDAVLVLQESPGRTLAWLVDANRGHPIPEAPVRFAVRVPEPRGRGLRWQEWTATTDAYGVASLETPAGELVCVAGLPGRPAIAVGHGSPRWQDGTDGWKVYAFTDRPAYRPGAMVDWKVLARRRVEGAYQTPVGQLLWFELRDPQGTTVTNGVLTLDAFGAAWGQFETRPQAGLGLYTVTFITGSANGEPVGTETLFRLEEYRLPEFEVTVTAPRAPESTAPAGAVRPGEPLTVEIEATYYFGSPVSGGTVEVVVHRRPFQWIWPVTRDYPWLQESGSSWPWRHEVTPAEVRRETLHLDAAGRAVFAMETDADSGDQVYSVTANVSDAGRRQVTGSAEFRVTREAYAVRARPLRNLPRPGEAIRIEFQAKDADGRPVVTTGAVRITREYWWEIWVDSLGREVAGEELKRLQGASPVWPPRPDPGQRDWQLKFRGYRAEELGARQVTLATNGVGELSFTTDRVGYYRFAWSSPDFWPVPGMSVGVTNLITAQASVWVTTTQPLDLGYRSSGLEIIVDADAFRTGTQAPVMIVGPNPDRWVLFTVQGGGPPKSQVLHLAGATRLVELDVTESLEPNAVLQAVLVDDRRVLQDRKEIVVPPTRNFLTVGIEPDPAYGRPGSEGALRITTRDAAGKPVVAQVAVSVVDDSLSAIQGDLAGDPRAFFFPRRYLPQLPVQSGFNRGRYLRLVVDEDGRWLDERTMGQDQAEFGVGGAMSPQLARRYGLNFMRGEDSDAVNVSTARFAEVQRAPPLPAMALADRSMKSSPAEAGEAAVVVRSDFRETAYWSPAVLTDASGSAHVAFRFPDATTRWGLRALAATEGAGVGLGTNVTRTFLPLSVRLQTPRFLVSGDEAVLSVVMDNSTDAPMTVSATLEADHLTLLGWTQGDHRGTGNPPPVEVPAGGSARVDWRTRAIEPGTAVLTATARAQGHSDAVRRTFPIVENGIEQWVSHAGRTTADDITVHLNLPPRRPDSANLAVRLTPSLAVTLLDALPYLADFPYGCTEQTMSRFLPAVIVRQTLATVGLDASAAMERAFGGISTNAAGQVSPGLGARKDLGKLDEMIGAGLKRLYDGQGQEAWGWWPGGGEDLWMTAYVVWGLRLAQQAGVEIEEERVTRAENWLRGQLVRLADRPDDAAWALHALASRLRTPERMDPDSFEARAFQRAYDQRTQLSAGGRALLAWAAHQFGEGDRARALVENLSNGVIRDEAPDRSVLYSGAVRGGSTQPTAYWGSRGLMQRWGDTPVEATAFSVRSLLALDPGNPLVQPAVAWLLQNRRGASWNNTRDTAITILCLTDYLRVSGELKQSLELELVVNGRTVATPRWTPADVLRAPAVFSVSRDLLGDTNEVRILRRGGEAPVYFSLEATCFTEGIPMPAGSGVFVRRELFRLVPVPTLLQGIREVSVPLGAEESVVAGDLVECRLVLEAKSDLEYLIIEDFKPAGFEATEVRSGWGKPAARLRNPEAPGGNPERMPRGPDVPLYFEWRDRRAAAFASRMPAGLWEIRYRYRVETPGHFAELPAMAAAMYVPELRGNSAGREIRITEPQP